MSLIETTMPRKLFVCLLIVVCSQLYSLAQQPPTSSIESEIVDVHGFVKRQVQYEVSPVVDALVRLHSETRGSRETLTGADGEFYLYKVAPGPYDLEIGLLDSHYTYQVAISGGAAVTDLPLIVLGEWVYYGNRFAPDNPGWQEVLFKNEARNGQDLPQVGDVVTAIGNISIRQGPNFRNGKDLLLQKETGRVVVRGNRLKVLEVREPFPGSPRDMENGSVWIRFLRVK
jgi:hypothetical protein